MRIQRSPGAKACRRPAAAAVEFAVVAPLLALLTVGTIEIGRAIHVKMALSDAVRHGCRLASEPRSDNAAVTKRVNAVLASNGINPANATVAYKVNDVAGDVKTAQEGDRVEVAVTVSLSNLTWVAPLILPEDAQQTERLGMMRQR